ncbi:MAG: M1 family peptidase, partial [Caldilineae bacterium]
PFAAGLIPAERATLDRILPGASVYHLDITLSDDLTHLSGREEVRYTNREDAPLPEVVFRLFPNLLGGKATVTNLTVNRQPAEPAFRLQESEMIVPLASPLAVGESVVIGMDFAVDVPTTAGSNYASFATLDGIAALAHFYPLIAVFDDEGWNAEIPPTYGDVVYADSSFYRVRVAAPAEVVLVASGVEAESRREGGTQTVTYAAGPVRDFYLAASPRYTRHSQTVGQTTLHSYAPDSVAASAEQALDYAADALRTFDARFGDYPFTELDLIATPTLAGGIEYPGVVVVALALYERRGDFFETATAHEVAHQWFYSVVGNDQVDDPWLDESLVQYATWLYYRDVHGATGDAGFRRVLEGYWNRAQHADTPIGLPVAAYTEEEYGAIVYGRGPLFFDALAQTIGQEAMDALLRDYYRTYQWDIATPEGLQQLAEAHCDCDLSPLFREWVFGEGE